MHWMQLVLFASISEYYSVIMFSFSFFFFSKSYFSETISIVGWPYIKFKSLSCHALKYNFSLNPNQTSIEEKLNRGSLKIHYGQSKLRFHSWGHWHSVSLWTWCFCCCVHSFVLLWLFHWSTLLSTFYWSFLNKRRIARKGIQKRKTFVITFLSNN